MPGITFARRAVATTAAAISVALVISGCGSNQAAEPTGQVEGSITYSLWGSPARAEKVDAVIDLFEEEYPDATVTSEIADYLSYVERLTVRAAGGDLACVIGTQSTFFATYANNDVLRPLDDLIESGAIDTSDIPDDVIEAGKIDGVQYMIPTGTFVRVLGYNEDLVNAAGVDAPSNDFTWEDYADWLHDLQDGLPAGVAAAEIEAGNMFSFTSWVVGNGETMFDGEGGLGFSKQTLEEWFDYWIELTNDGVTVPTASIPEQNGAIELAPMSIGTAAAGTRDIPHLFITENALAGAGKPSTIGSISIPSEDPDESANILGSNGLSIPAECDNVSTAAAFIDFFANNEDAALAFQSDNGILTNSVAQEALVADADTPDGVKQNVTIFSELADAGDVTTSTYPEGLATMTTELLRLYQQAAFGQSSVSAAVDEFFVNAQNAID